HAGECEETPDRHHALPSLIPAVTAASPILRSIAQVPRLSHPYRAAVLLAAVAFLPSPVRAQATASAAVKPYTETIPGTDVKFSMTPIPGGTFTIGSPADEPKRSEDEGPQRNV